MPELPPEHAVALGNLLGDPPNIPRPGAPAPPPEPEPEAPDPRDTRIAELEAQNKEHVSNLSEANAQLRRMLEEMRKPQAPAAPQPQVTDEQLDGMTPAQLTRFLLTSIGQGMDMLNNQNVLEMSKIRLEGQLRDLYTADPTGFDKHREDIVTIVREKKGSISPEEALDIAKARAARNAGPEEEEVSREEAPRPRVAATRGVTPGTRAGSGSRPGKPAPPPANSREAAQRAMKAIFPGGVRR